MKHSAASLGVVLSVRQVMVQWGEVIFHLQVLDFPLIAREQWDGKSETARALKSR